MSDTVISVRNIGKKYKLGATLSPDTLRDYIMHLAGQLIGKGNGQLKHPHNEEFWALKDVSFDSAGLFHYYETPQEGTIKYLNSKGIDISDFHAKKIDDDLLIKQDLILGFEQKHHLNKLKRKFKQNLI